MTWPEFKKKWSRFTGKGVVDQGADVAEAPDLRAFQLDARFISLMK